MELKERVRPPLHSSLLSSAPAQRWHSVSRRGDLRPLSRGRSQTALLGFCLVFAVLALSGGVLLWWAGQDANAGEQSPQVSEALQITPVPPTPSPLPAEPTATPMPTSHVVRPGESLTAIAERYNTTVAVLAELNGIANPNAIRAGTELRLPSAQP